ncbi:MAG: T9SS type A sorting domain-containing protein [Tannerella sp.]|nr:T9SS type A sorting domain-containing protein [Tannerella sp.]
MKKITFLRWFVCAILFCSFSTVSADDLPLVYGVENTGAAYPAPDYTTLENAPSIIPLPDPFMWANTDPRQWMNETLYPNGSARSTDFADWSRRRAEIVHQIQHYEIGEKPAVKREDVTASWDAENNTLTVVVENGERTLTITSRITIPEGSTAPYPAVIGMNSGTGSLPAALFSSRGIAQIAFSHNQVTTYSGHSNEDPFYRLYPQFNVDNHGQYAAWAWGVSRIIDGLEIVRDELPIDMQHIAVTGCSYAGKMALFAGALDERVALTIPQESGGGGVAAWRVSETLGGVENLGATSHEWFKEGMFAYSGTNTAKLPHDHHALAALVAPRALLVYGNPDYTWLADQSGHVSILAAKEVWKTWDIEDRVGYYIERGRAHCAFPENIHYTLECFLDRFLLGRDVETNISESEFENVDHNRWISWWGNTPPEMGAPPGGDYESFWAEAERLVTPTQGNGWTVLDDDEEASNGKYIVELGQNGSSDQPLNSAPGPEGCIVFPFTVTQQESFFIYARLRCKDADDDSFWVKVDNGNFGMINGLATGDVWTWKNLVNAPLTPGEHSVTIGYRENGGKVDKLCITNSPYAPEGKGEDDPLPNPVIAIFDGYSLGYSYPNPAVDNATLSFSIPRKSLVTIRLIDTKGTEIKILKKAEYPEGKHSIEIDLGEIAPGVYFYQIQAGPYNEAKKLIVTG